MGTLLAEQRSTGLTGLDSQLGGGIPSGSCIVLISQPMNAQELLAYQFAAGGDGESVVFASTHQSAEEVELAMQAIGLELDGISIASITGAAIPSGAKAQRYVLDNISEYNDANGWEATMKVLNVLRKGMRANGGIALVIATEGLHTEAELTRLRMWGDGAMEMGFDRQGFGLYPYLKVTKMRGVPDSARFLLFKETPRGLFMESTRRVF